jgi:bacteriorhodopsin
MQIFKYMVWCPHLVDEGLSILQYDDDTIIFMVHDLQKACKMKLSFYAFEQLSGLKINFHKSEVFWGNTRGNAPIHRAIWF